MMRAAMLIVVASVFARVLGFARELAVAYFFGAGSSTDAFFLAYQIPALIAGSLAAALAASLIPLFTERHVTGRTDEAWRLTVGAMNLVGLSLLGMTIVFVALGPWVIGLMAPGFDQGTKAEAVSLFRILMPLVVFAGLAGVGAGALNSLRRFGLPAFSVALGAFVVLAVLVATARSLGLVGLALGTTLGAAVGFIVLVPRLVRSGLPFRFGIEWDDPGFRRFLGMIWPVLLGSVVSSVSIVTDQVLGSLLEPGSISALSYSGKLLHLPLGLLAAAVTVPLFPLLSENVARNEAVHLRENLQAGLSMLAFLLVPASVGLVVLRVPIVTLLFERGAFEAEDTQRTAWALLFYALCMFPYAGRDLLNRVFYSYQDPRTPLLWGLGAVVLNVAASLVLMRFFAVGGLALGTTISFSVHFTVLLLVLRRRDRELARLDVSRPLLRVAVAALIMAGAVWGLDHALWDASSRDTIGTAIRVTLDVVVGAMVYLGVAAIGRFPEMTVLLKMGARVFERRKSQAAGPGT